MSLRGGPLLVALAAWTLAGCVGLRGAGRWSPVAAPSELFLALPPGAPVVGLGAKASPRGLVPKRCLAAAGSSTATGTFWVQVHPADPPFRSGDLATDAFVERCSQRADQARRDPGAPAPVAALLEVGVSGQWTSLEDSSATFSGEANRLLATREVWSFFERCGARYVRAARRAPSALIYVALYPSSAPQRARWVAQIAARAGRTPDDLFSLRVLDELVQGTRVFLAVRADTDEVLELVAPGTGPERGTARLVGNALRASFGADRGRIAELSLQPWSMLPAAAALLRLPGDPPGVTPGRREGLFQRLKLLEGRALDQEALLARIAEAGGAAGCRAALERDLAPFSWDAYYRCRDAAWAELPATLEKVGACRPVLAALERHALPVACEGLSLDDGRFADPRKRSDTRSPLLLEMGPGSRQLPDDAHLYEDATQLAEVPAPGGPGAQTDRWGNAFTHSCVRGAPGAAAQVSPLEAPSPLPRPWSQDDWDGLSRRKQPPARPPPPPAKAPPPKEKPLCIEPPGGNGSAPVCLHQKGTEPPKGAEPAPAPSRGFVPETSERPQTPPEAKTAASQAGARREVILGVSANERLEGERHWPWWKRVLYPLLFSWKAPEPRPIYRGAYELRTLHEGSEEEVHLTDEAAALAREDLPAFYRACGTHRVSQVIERKGVAYHFAPGSPGDLEISVLPYGVSRKAAESPALHPERVRDFLEGRSSWLEELSARSSGLPWQLVLEPWSELLLEAGVVQPHQLSPRNTEASSETGTIR